MDPGNICCADPCEEEDVVIDQKGEKSRYLPARQHPYDDYTQYHLETLNHKLHFACGKGNTGWIRKAVADGAELEARRGVKGGRLIHHAPVGSYPGTAVGAASGRVSFLSFAAHRLTNDCQNLRHAEGANEQRTQGVTPLMRAALEGHVEAIQLLLDLRANLEAANEAGATALHLAAGAGSRDACLALIRAGASRRALDAQGRDALDCLPAYFRSTRSQQKEWEALLRPAGRWEPPEEGDCYEL